MPLSGAALDGVTRAHPVSSHPHVEVPILLVVLAGAMGVALVALLVPSSSARPGTDDEATGEEVVTTASWMGRLTPAQWAARVPALALVLLAVVAGRIGLDDELENLAPALVVGAGVPLLVLACLAYGGTWRWLDPWDTVGRLVDRDPPDDPAAHPAVWPAVVLVVPWLWFLGAYSQPLDPRPVGLALAAYAVVTVAGCLALGRIRWLAAAEPLGLLLTWVGLLPRRRLNRWAPPAGAAALLGVVITGLLFGLVRRTELWSPLVTRPHATLWATAGLLVACAVGGAAAWVASRVGPSADARAVVARTLVPVTAGVILAVALARNRFTTSVQLLPGLLGDPLGRGWDLFGSAIAGLDPAPLGAVGLVVVQLGVVGVAHLVAAATTVRPLVGDERLPAIMVLAGSVALSVTALSLH